MSTTDTTRFFDTSGCLNLSRPSSHTRKTATKQPSTRPRTASSVPIRGQVKIDLYNFDHIDFANSKYVLTSPRSLEACARLGVKPAELLPKKLADIKTDKVRYSTLMDVRDEMEMERLAKLQRCREERENVIREQTIEKPSSARIVDSKPTNVNDRIASRRPQPQTKFNPSSSLTQGLKQPTTIKSVPNHYETTSKAHQLPPRPTPSVRPTVIQWPSPDDHNELRASSSAGFLDDVRRMDRNLQRLGTSNTNKIDRYVNGLENVKHIIEQRATGSASDNNLDNASFEKKQYELLLSHYDHELKIERARENARRTEKEKEAERHETLMHDYLDQTMAEERRRNGLRQKLDKLHDSRQLYDALQAKNHELQMADVQKRRLELLNEIKRKDRRTQHFVKDKQEAVNLSRTIAKSSQDTRAYIRETKESFDQKAKKAELTTSILVTKPKVPVDRRHLQTSIQT